MNGAGWACPTCAARCDAAARHCSACGEQRLPLPGWRFSLARWRLTLRCLVLQPGRLTADHALGRRQPYVPPLSLFLAINVVFFVAQSLSGLSVLSIGLLAPLLGLLQHWGHVPAHADLDNFATAIEAVVIGSYFYLAAGRVFGAGRLWRLLAAVVLVFAVLWTLYLHRFAIFLATVWMV